MLNSVRVRLTLWHTGILALILVSFALGVYLLVAQRLYRQLDHQLHSVLDVVTLSLRHEIEEHKGEQPGEAMFREVLATLHQASFPRQSIRVFAGDRLVASKPGLAPAPERPSAEGPGFVTVNAAEGDQRVGIARTRVFAQGSEYTVIAAEPTAEVRAELTWIREILLITVPLAIAIAAACGYLLARKSLAPVVAMSEEVDQMTARNLSTPLTVSNPKDELGRLASTFNRLLERLHEAMEQQRRFMADASHELRTPIAVSRTAVEVNLDGADRPTAEYREALGVVGVQMKRLSRVVHDMFTLARADQGEYRIHFRTFHLNDVLEEALQAARLLARAKGIEVRSEAFPESPATGDEDLIRQLILILLDNAVKYTPAGGTVELRLEPGYRITVRDTGMGIPPEARERIFDRFYRVDKARSRSSADRSGGAGLGLAIAEWIAGVHQGKVELVSSEVGSGSVFRATLPV